MLPRQRCCLRTSREWLAGRPDGHHRHPVVPQKRLERLHDCHGSHRDSPDSHVERGDRPVGRKDMFDGRDHGLAGGPHRLADCHHGLDGSQDMFVGCHDRLDGGDDSFDGSREMSTDARDISDNGRHITRVYEQDPRQERCHCWLPAGHHPSNPTGVELETPDVRMPVAMVVAILVLAQIDSHAPGTLVAPSMPACPTRAEQIFELVGHPHARRCYAWRTRAAIQQCVTILGLRSVVDAGRTNAADHISRVTQQTTIIPRLVIAQRNLCHTVVRQINVLCVDLAVDNRDGPFGHCG